LLTIAQISDLHVTTDKDPLNRQRNETRLRQVLNSILQLQPRPVAIVASGDLVDRGEIAEYVELRRLLDGFEIPIHYGLGNHDNRAAFLEAFEGAGPGADPDGFVQYVVDFGALRMVMVDTLDQGREGGAFCERRATWLAATLDEAPDQPTVIALHHPPIVSGIQWMDPDPGEPWIARLADTVRGRTQVRSMICGHVHRAFAGQFAGQIVAAAPATSIQLTLNLTPIDMEKADGREILVEEPPGYVLVMANGDQVSAHVCVAGDYPSAVNYTRPFRMP
jgi:3',5'-cyclic AMP phosphodiesterase CpdA